MKILFIAPKYTGGIGGHASRVAEKLQEYGFDVKLMHTSHIPIKKLKKGFINSLLAFPNKGTKRTIIFIIDFINMSNNGLFGLLLKCIG